MGGAQLPDNPFCPRCAGTRLGRVLPLWHERLRRRPPLFYCRDCDVRFFYTKGAHTPTVLPHGVHYCWRCGGDLDRRRAKTPLDYLMRLLGVRAYSCRGCNARRWGL